jgi:hypothetical protein
VIHYWLIIIITRSYSHPFEFMANTTLQNCQRAIILLWFASLAAIITLLTVRLIKKKIDLRARPKQEDPPSESAADKYKES